jgi:ATP-dependent Clp protease ATP-binding subunit ClpC
MRLRAGEALARRGGDRVDDGIQVGGPGPSLSGLAQQAAAAAQGDRLETPHILLALLGPVETAAGRVLAAHSVTREKVQTAVSQVVQAGVREERHALTAKRIASCQRSGVRPPTRQAEQAFLAAIDEARLRGDRVATWGHALLGLLRVGDGIAARVLVELGVDLTSIRDEVLKGFQPQPSDADRHAEPGPAPDRGGGQRIRGSPSGR